MFDSPQIPSFTSLKEPISSPSSSEEMEDSERLKCLLSRELQRDQPWNKCVIDHLNCDTKKKLTSKMSVGLKGRKKKWFIIFPCRW